MKETTLAVYKERMLRVLVHIQQNLDEVLTLDQLAGVAHFSPYHFHRIFRGMLGETVQGHIRRLRLERAASRLKLTEAPVTRIAFDAGYETHEAFTRAFKAMSGSSPSEYRRDHSPLVRSPLTSGIHYVEAGTIQDFDITPMGGGEMNVKIKQMEPMRVVFMRHVGPYNQVGSTWGALCARLGPKGLLGPGAHFLGLCYDDPEVTPQEKIRYDACVRVDEDFQPEDDLGVQDIPGGDYAVITHLGPYEKLNETYAKLLGQWLPKSGRELKSAPCYEVYLNDPGSTAPEDLVTDIHVPLEPK